MNNKLSDKSILILTSALLFPARRNGVSIRYYPFAKELTQRGYTIDLIVINKFNSQYTKNELNEAHKIYRSIQILETNKIKTGRFKKLFKKIVNSLSFISPTGIPHGLIDNNKQFYLAELKNLLRNQPRYTYSIGVDVGGGNAILLNELPAKIKPHNIICDFVDSAYLLRKRSHRTMFASINPIVILENIKTKQWEKRISYSMPSIYISKNDAVATDSNATIIPNCVVNEDYQEAISAQVLSPSIGFIGNMKYQPNIEACDFLCNEIFPALLNTRPDIQLYIIGRNPGKRLLKHNQHPNIHITGSVSNIWSYVKPIDAFIFPMVSGAGLQNKVLEAMYAGKPVICSQIANEGIDAVHEKELYIANTISEYVMHTEKALLQGNSVGECAKNFIENHFSLQNCVDLLEQTITLKSPGNFSSTTKTL